MNESGWSGRLEDLVHVTDYVANGSFAALKENVEYSNSPSYAVLVRTVDFNRGWSGEYVWVDKRAYDFLDKSSLVPGDLVISNVGSVGTAFRVPNLGVPVTLGPNAVLCRTRNPRQLDQRFLYYYFTSRTGQEAIRSIISGSVQSKFNKGSLRALRVRFPPISDQQATASVLGALDDKIELNRRMSETLGSISRTIFREWVIDRRETPTTWDTTEWDSRPLDEIADFLNGAACQRFPVEEGEPSLPVIKIRELNQGITPQSDRVSVNIPQKWHIRDGDVIFSWSGTLLTKIWTGGEAALNQHLFKVTSQEFPKWFYYHWVLYYLEQFRDIAADKATTMGHIRRHHLTEAICLIPDSESMEKLGQLMEPLLNRQLTCDIESNSLAELRDALLPKLISGELRIPEAEHLVSEVA